MHYLRMLTNALIGGALVGAYVTLLVLQLNPSLILPSLGAVRVMAMWWAFYGFNGAVVFYMLLVLRQLFASEVRSPGWLSLRLLAQFGTFALAMAAVVTWFNLRGFGIVLGPEAARRMTSGATVLSVCAVICTVLPMVHLPLARGRRSVEAIFRVVLMAYMLVPLVVPWRGVALP